jgi:hypothetical protein
MGYPRGVAAISPTVEGFRATLRRPAISFAEIIWRWSVGAVAILLFFFGAYEYLSSLPVTSGEILFLHTKQPILIARALDHIFRGSWNRGLAAGLLAALALALLWLVAASVGRMATVVSLLEYFETRLESSERNESPRSMVVFRSLFRLNFLRLVIAVAAISGFAGAGILAGFASPDGNSNLGLAFLTFIFVASFVALAWWILNWLLSLGAVCAVREGEDALAAIASAVTLCRERATAVFAVSFWTAMVHLALFVAATSIVVIPIALVGTIAWRMVASAVFLITILYFAVADWIHVARIAGYVCIGDLPDLEVSAGPREIGAFPPFGTPATAIARTEAAVDRDELILSDVPNPLPEA